MEPKILKVYFSIFFLYPVSIITSISYKLCEYIVFYAVPKRSYRVEYYNDLIQISQKLKQISDT